MGRSPCCEKVGLKKGPWTPEEDQKLLGYIEEHGHGNWRALPTKAGLERCGKSCRLRWTNYLRPDIKRGKFSLQEEQTIIQLHALLGNRWSAIATHLPKRTDNEIKNYWNTHLKKRLSKMGIDPITHKPKNDTLGVSSSSDDSGSGAGAQYSKSTAANLSHMAQWESARLEAEARLVRQSKLRCNSSITSSALMLNNNFNNHNAAAAGTTFTTNSSNPDDAVLPYPTSTSASASASASASSSSSRCLDVLRACQYGTDTQFWHNSNDKISSSSGTGVGGSGEEEEEEERGTDTTTTTTNTGTTTTGPHHHSPTSTLSFSENGPSSAVAPPGATSATMIEFMGGNNNGNNNHNDYSEAKMMMAKENAAKITTGKGSPKGEGEGEGKGKGKGKGDRQHDQLSWKPNHLSPDHDQYNDGINSMSITSVPHQHNNVGTLSVDQEHDIVDDDNANHSYEFMDGFTELLLSNFTSHRPPNLFMDCEDSTTTTTTNNNNKNSHNNSTTGGAGAGIVNANGTSTTATDQFYDDNSKSYWNSILHLVDSSPSSNSPLF